MTKLLYLENQDLFTTTAKIKHIHSDDRGFYIILDQTLFYPQGGGQPADQGNIKTKNHLFTIYDVRNVNSEIRHYTTTKTDILNNESAIIEITKARRLLNTRYHSAGHLIASLVEKLSPTMQAVKGHQFPEEAYVEFLEMPDIDPSSFLMQLQKELSRIITSGADVKTLNLDSTTAKKIMTNLPYDLPMNKELRICKIAEFDPTPCGGTHVTNLKQIGNLLVIKCKSKKGRTKIFYEVN
ncbi:MAG: hypothetical protein HRU35_06195 [Rickettsiaceae bacterium]|nr:hypothetical protein [Rickettsiaceae bacterium]